MFQFAILFLIGNLALQCSEQLPAASRIWWITACVVFTVAGLIVYRTTATPWRIRLQWLMRVVLALLLGFSWAWWHAAERDRDRLSNEMEGQDLVVEGVVENLPEADDSGQRFQVAVIKAPAGVPAHLQLTWYATTPQVQVAEHWRWVVRLKQPHGYANPGGQDYELQLFRQGIGATGYIRTDTRNQRLGVQPGRWVLKARAAIIARIEQALPAHPMQGIVRGLAVGDQQAISSDAWRVFARTGVSHLMAISGFHVGMVAWLFAAASRALLWLPWAQRWRLTAPRLRAVFGMSGALSYSLLAGMSIPTERTLIMLGVYFAALWSRRALNVWQGYGIALLLVLLVDPFAPLSVGPWLSFGAVAVILLNKHGRLGRDSEWRAFIKLQAVVTLGLAPLLLICFGNLSLVSPFVNLAAIPWFSVVLAPLTLIGCALLFVNAAIGQWWLQGVAWLIERTVETLHWAASLPWAVSYWPSVPTWVLVLLVLGTLMIVIPWTTTLRAIGALLCLPALCWRPASLPAGALRMTTLDVGQGLAVVIQTHNHVLLYDAGPVFQSGRNTGDMVVLPYLHAVGTKTVDVVMASHGDADHVGGLAAVLSGIPVVQFIRGPSVKPVNAHDVICQQGQHWQWDEVTFTVLHPDLTQLEKSDNNQSCVLRIDAPGGSVLLMGDAERPVEETLVAANRIAPVTIVEAGHHGSRSSSSEAFVAATQAKHVIFSAGYRNRWGFPRPEVVERWQQHGAQLVATVDSGAVAYTLLPDGTMQTERYRTLHPHYWSHVTEPVFALAETAPDRPSHD